MKEAPEQILRENIRQLIEVVKQQRTNEHKSLLLGRRSAARYCT